MSPAALHLLAVLGNGPITELAMVGRLVGKGYSYDAAVITVKNCLVELVLAKKAEQVHPYSVYRLSASTPMEGDA
jgi:hypothetical protein